jgi:hypothetical protein
LTDEGKGCRARVTGEFFKIICHVSYILHLLPRRGNTIGPNGGTALAAQLEKLNALQALDLRCCG